MFGEDYFLCRTQTCETLTLSCLQAGFCKISAYTAIDFFLYVRGDGGGCGDGGGWWLEWGGSSVCVKETNRPCTNSACDVFLCS